MPRQLDTLYSRSQTLATPSPHPTTSGSSTGLPGEGSARLKAVVTDDHYRRPMTLGASRDLQATRSEGTGLLGDGTGHRRGQGPRRSEELDPVAHPAAGRGAFGGDPD